MIMWVPGSLAFLLPLFGIGVRLLFGEEQASGVSDEAAVAGQAEPGHSAAPGRSIALS